ncbi:MAG: two-component regulator propeller domain-containing protein [Pyrinomonadaceae bacterium]
MKRLEKKIGSRSIWLKPGENESRFAAHHLLLAVLLLLTICGSLLIEPPSLTVGLMPRVLSQNVPQAAQPQPSPTPSPTPTPSPSPTPPPNLHQWGALTSFHGLPSDRARAIAQEQSGVTWFATDGGLAMFNGRRTHAVISEGLPKGRVLALKIDDSGTIWIGTDTGAAWMANGKTHPIKETSGKAITTIVTRGRDHVLMASENGQIFDCRVQRGAVSEMRAGEGVPQVSFTVQAIPTEPLQSADKDQPGPLKITSLAMVGEKLYVGTHSRGVLVIENGDVKEVVSRPRSFFINALETDAKGRLWVGARGGKEESAIFDQSDPLKPVRANAPTGPVTAIARGTGEDIWVATDGRGAFHLRDGKIIERFTFVGTGGALRSDHVYGIFIDAEDVVWFATDKGVCRYDPNAARTEAIANDANANYVRALWLTSKGSLLAGTNAGLFTHDAAESAWSPIADVGRRIVYAINEDNSGRVLIGTSSGLLASSNRNELAFARVAPSSNNLPEGDSVRAIANVDGATYIATYGYGVEKLNGSTRTFVWPASSADSRQREVTALGRDPTGRLVIGTATAGVFFWDGKEARAEPALEKLKGDAVWAALADSDGLWLASARGLYFYKSGELRELAPGVHARALFPSADNSRAGQVWCATVGNGLLRVSLDDQFGAVVSRFDIEQGLASQRVFGVVSTRGQNGSEQVMAATNRGVVRYQPSRGTPTVLPSRVIGQRIHQQSELPAGLHLDYPQNSLLLDVTAISSRTFPEQFQYAFALYDNTGKIIRQKLSHDSQFPMEQLSAGKYKVIARAFTKDLTPAVPLSFEFTVARAPFPWTSTALGVLLLLALIALVWGYAQNRRIHRTSAELAGANRELADARLRLANETEAERRRIARDLHDQTLADLRHLALLVDQIPLNAAARPNRAPSAPNALRAEIESISHEVRRICEDLSPSALENVGLSAALQFALAHAVEQAAPECKFEYDFVCDDAIEEKLQLTQSTQIQIYRIAQEALSNICRHAHAKRVKMSAGIAAGNQFELQIEDDGRGYDEADARRNSGRGVANIRTRASMIDADVAWAKRNGGGTVFSLRK